MRTSPKDQRLKDIMERAHRIATEIQMNNPRIHTQAFVLSSLGDDSDSGEDDNDATTTKPYFV